MSDTLEVALLVRGTDVPAWQASAVEAMLARTDAEVSHVVRSTGSVAGSDGGLDHYLDRVREYPLWTPVGAAFRFTDRPPYRRPREVGDIAGLGGPETLAVEPDPAPDFGNVLPDHAVETVGEADVAIRFGFGILKGDVLDAPDHGVLSFHHGDLRKYRGMPSGFWEYLHDEDTAGVTLQRLSETLDGGAIVAYEPVDIAEAPTWPAVRRRLFSVSDDVLVKGVRNVSRGVEPRSPDDLGDLYSLPEGGDVLKYVVKEGKGRVRQVVE
ncbi:formyltransferase family protein [Halorussus caseinilyticus]|uniref:Formyltransferase family protein n=1 Tax=Halorussus caseinilyticus TaxID=3034025 RepID=A0ABD5WM92_9EURY|nr:formyltransferase family protein [Halorussus sp. DT72]